MIRWCFARGALGARRGERWQCRLPPQGRIVLTKLKEGKEGSTKKDSLLLRRMAGFGIGTQAL
jgi:hypothetical protein